MLVNTPPMGWNTWNTFGNDINDAVVRESADKFIELGLDKAGYKYVVIDDCWSERERDPETGKIVPDKEKFPKGMKNLSDYVHSKGLKFGMYSCAGVRTCGDFPGSFDHEFLDAKTFAEFGCDFLKYDFCYRPPTAYGPLLYRRMGQALRASGRDILFSACNWGSDDVWSWIRSTGAHMYRSTGDIFDNPVSFTAIAKSQVFKYCYSAPQCFNDIDMLTVGMFGKGNVGTTGCDLNHYKLQFSLWCMLGSPLMLGCDIRKMTPEILDLVTNKELIAIDQDPEARPAFVPGLDKACELNGSILTLCRLLSNGDFALASFNMTNERQGSNLCFETIGFPAAAGVELHFREIFTGETMIPRREMMQIDLPAYGVKFYRVTPVLK